MIDDFGVDDMVAVNPLTQSEDFPTGKFIHVHFGTDELSIHYWGA